jgi:hypothetical protein
MKLAKTMLVAAVAIIPVSVAAQERAGNAAIGAVTGAVVFGPVGALAGAAVGYTAGQGIAHDWGLRRWRPAHRVRRTNDR